MKMTCKSKFRENEPLSLFARNQLSYKFHDVETRNLKHQAISVPYLPLNALSPIVRHSYAGINKRTPDRILMKI